jgi:site-specific DNA recombinase
MGVIAEFERGRIGERIREGRQFRTTQGKWTSGQTLYGYRWLPKEQKWEIIEEEAKVVRHIYDLYSNEKIGTLHIHERLNQEGLRTREGYLWHYGFVLSILSNPAYRGTHRTGLKMPVIIEPSIWDKVEQQRHAARQVRGKPRNWLLQGLCVCGIYGHKLGCHKKKNDKNRYYVCRGRHKEHHPDGSQPCQLPYIRAEELEFLVWNKVKQTFGDPDRLREYVDKALYNLEQQKSQLGSGYLDIEKGLTLVKKKEERLGIAYADSTLPQNVYKAKLQQLKKQEKALEQRQHNLNPSEMIKIAEISHRVTAVKELLQKGKVHLTGLGFFAAEGDKYVPLGFNPWPESDGKVAIGNEAEMDIVYVDKENGLVGKSNVPPGFLDPDIPASEKKQRVLTNWRELLRFLDIKVTIYPDRKEIRGAIPPQLITNPPHNNTVGTPITSAVER